MRSLHQPATRRGLFCGLLLNLNLTLALTLALGAAAVRAAPAEFTGIVYPQADLTLSVHVAGVVDRVMVSVGQAVRAGQVLLIQDARLQRIEQERRRLIARDETELQTIERRRAALAGLVKDAATLYEQAGTVSRDELTKLRMELDATSGRSEQLREAKKREAAELALAEREEAMRQLVAPVAGVVTMLKVQPGEWAAPGEPILRLVDAAQCELRVYVSQAAARRLKAGQTVAVLVDEPAEGTLPAKGRVGFVSPVVDAASALVEVRVQLPNPGGRIRPGVKARLQVELGA
jgi:RND family efflux transporter MFP subunit